MIEDQTIGGRKAVVAYLTADFEPANRDNFALAKVTFDDGAVLFVAGDDGEHSATAFGRHRGKGRRDLSGHEGGAEIAGFGRQRAKHRASLAEHEARNDGGAERGAFGRHRDKHRASLAEHEARRESKAESDAWLRHRAKRAPQERTRGPLILGHSYAWWARIMLADDLSRIDSAIRNGLTEGFDNTEIARSIVGSQSLKGVDGATEITRQRIARLGYAAIKGLDLRGTS